MNKLAIVGSHPGTRNLVPWDDTNFDIWTINEASTMKDTWAKRTTAIIQLHPRSIWDNPKNRNDPHHGEWLKANKEVIIYMMEKFPDVPMAVEYPLKEIVNKFLGNFEVFSPRSRNEYMTCTVAYMAGLAAYLGYKEVNFYGVELSVDSEYRFQRPGAAFWIGVLTQNAKVKFYGRMFDAPLYGYEEEGEVRKDLLLERINKFTPGKDVEAGKIEPLNATFVQALTRFRETGVEYETAVGAWRAFTNQLNKYGVAEGVIQELESRVKEIDEMIELDGEYRFSHHGFIRKAEAIQKKLQESAMQHAYMSGVIDVTFNQAVDQRLQDSKRKKAIDTFVKLIPDYVKLCQTIGIYNGAMNENRFLATVIQEKENGDDKQLCDTTTL